MRRQVGQAAGPLQASPLPQQPCPPPSSLARLRLLAAARPLRQAAAGGGWFPEPVAVQLSADDPGMLAAAQALGAWLQRYDGAGSGLGEQSVARVGCRCSWADQACLASLVDTQGLPCPAARVALTIDAGPEANEVANTAFQVLPPASIATVDGNFCIHTYDVGGCTALMRLDCVIVGDWAPLAALPLPHLQLCDRGLRGDVPPLPALTSLRVVRLADAQLQSVLLRAPRLHNLELGVGFEGPTTLSPALSALVQLTRLSFTDGHLLDGWGGAVPPGAD